MHIVIIGAGAVGGYFGALLQETGTRVTFVARGATLEALRTRGLYVHSPQGSSTVAVNVVESIEEVAEADAVFLATKTIDGHNLPERLPHGAVLVTTQNSVEMPAIAIEKYGPSKVVPGVVRSFLVHDGPGEVRFSGGVLSFTFGSVDPGTKDIVAALSHALGAAGIKPYVLDDILVDVWAKAMFVTTFGALGALVNKPMQDVRTTYRRDLEALMREVELAGRANGIALPADVVEESLTFADQQPAQATSSMQRDILAGLPNELDAQVGAVLRMAARAGVAVPLHTLIYDTLAHRGD